MKVVKKFLQRPLQLLMAGATAMLLVACQATPQVQSTSQAQSSPVSTGISTVVMQE